MKLRLALVLLAASTAHAEIIKITVTPNPANGTFAARRQLVVDAVNLSEKSIDITSATITLPAWYDTAPRTTEATLADLEGDLNAHHNGSHTLVLQQLSTSQAFMPILTTPPLFFYKKLPGVVTIRYQYANEDVEQEPIRYEYTLPAEAPFWHLILGGMLGTIVAFGIARLAGKMRSTKASKPWQSFALALFVVPVTIGIARLTTNFLPLPFEIDLRDAAGGFLVGICSLWFTPKIVERILGGPPAAPGGGGVAQPEATHTAKRT